MNLLAWTMNVTACLAVFSMSRRWWWAPLFGLAQQFLWLAWCIASRQWAFLVCSVFFAVTYASAIPTWYRERKP